MQIYKADVAVLGGDLTGKILVPVIEDAGTYRAELYGTKYIANSDKELENLKSKIRNMGYYFYVISKEDFEDIKKDKQRLDRLFTELSKKQIQDWVHLVKEKLEDANTPVYITGGNDDPPEVIKMLEESQSYPLIYAGDNVLNIEVKSEKYEMLSLGYSNPTPWNCPRDISEDELGEKIQVLAKEVSNMRACIFNVHVPPYGTVLDIAPKLDENFNVKMSGGQPVMINVGSKSVREALEKYQPMIGLHGHIHESRGVTKLGSTYCFNPGSEYAEGILRGVIINVDKGKVKNYLFTFG